MGRDVIIACDFAGKRETIDFLDRFGGERPFVKVGMELFYSEGPGVVRTLKERGHRVFLDLKLHDIPNTVKKAMSVLCGLGADMINLHAAGGKAMMGAALESLTRPDGTRPMAIAVTMLTSVSREMMNGELLIPGELERAVSSYARFAYEAGLDGVVCSPLESAAVHRECGAGFLAVTPGVRFAGGETGGHSRITTPADAKSFGSDYIVVGRPITAAPDPLSAYQRCVEEFVGGAV